MTRRGGRERTGQRRAGLGIAESVSSKHSCASVNRENSARIEMPLEKQAYLENAHGEIEEEKAIGNSNHGRH